MTKKLLFLILLSFLPFVGKVQNPFEQFGYKRLRTRALTAYNEFGAVVGVFAVVGV